MWAFYMLLFAGCVSSLTAAAIAPLSGFPRATSSLQIVARTQPGQPWTVAGENGAIFGRQNGKFEAWLWPVKLLSNFSIRAELFDYPVPIDVNALSADIRVTPAETVITYSHAAFTIRQRMFASRGKQSVGPSAAVTFEIDSVRPLALTFSFTPEMLRMWPAPNHGRPGGEWIAQGDSGLYVLHTDDADFSGIVAMPHTKPGVLVPYQERPQTYPLELRLNFDPKRDVGLTFPLLMAMKGSSDPAAQATDILGRLPNAYRSTRAYYQAFF